MKSDIFTKQWLKASDKILFGVIKFTRYWFHMFAKLLRERTLFYSICWLVFITLLIRLTVSFIYVATVNTRVSCIYRNLYFFIVPFWLTLTCCKDKLVSYSNSHISKFDHIILFWKLVISNFSNDLTIDYSLWIFILTPLVLLLILSSSSSSLFRLQYVLIIGLRLNCSKLQFSCDKKLCNRMRMFNIY